MTKEQVWALLHSHMALLASPEGRRTCSVSTLKSWQRELSRIRRSKTEATVKNLFYEDPNDGVKKREDKGHCSIYAGYLGRSKLL